MPMLNVSIMIFHCAGAVLGEEAEKIGLKTAAIFCLHFRSEKVHFRPEPGRRIINPLQ